jgi:transcriptional regulator with XRE-family HTH domain
MKQREITTKQLAADVGIPEGTLKTWLAGSAPRSLADVRRVAQFLNVSFEFIVFGEEFNDSHESKNRKSYEVLLRLTVEPIANKNNDSLIKGVRVEEIKPELA